MMNRPPFTHDVKIWPEFYHQVIMRQKWFELRVDDRDPKYMPGDSLRLNEFMPDTQTYTGNAGLARIRNVHRGIPCLKSGCVALDILFIGSTPSKKNEGPTELH